MNSWWPTVCLGVWLFLPVVTFVLGVKIGRGQIRLPFRVRIERREDEYAVDAD